METGWSNPVTTKAMITAIKNAGFNAIRIPVSWTKAAGGAPNYTIRADWMARVVEVVNYAVENDMYIILNTHHDEDVFGFLNSNVAAGKAAFGKIWEQIAATFKNYNEKLIFEGLNEPRTIDSANEWGGGTPEERANLNSYYPIFVNAVRNSGGNNIKRCLMINTYAATTGTTEVNALVLPSDTAANKLIASIHVYAPRNFCYGSDATFSSSNPSDIAAIEGEVLPAYNKFVQNGIPVIVGEFGAQYKNNAAAQKAWATYIVSYMRSKGMACILFDNNIPVKVEDYHETFGLFNRSAGTFYYPDYLAGLMEGANTPYVPPVGSEPSPSLVVNNPTFSSPWGATATIGADGWVTWSGDGALIAWAFPAGWNSYSKITVTYEVRNVNTAVGSGAPQLVIKRPKNGEMYTLLTPNDGTITSTGGNNPYPWLSSTGGTLVIDRVAANFDGCIGFQFNPDGYGYEIRISKVEFHN